MSDLDVLDDVYGTVDLPAVASHEVIGDVIRVGATVDSLRPGQRVGGGPHRLSCAECVYCRAGQENLCSRVQMTPAAGLRGGFAAAMQVSARFAFPVPDEIDSASAPPGEPRYRVVLSHPIPAKEPTR